MDRLILVGCFVLGAVGSVAFGGERVLRQEVVIDAPIGEVWEAWTTDEGIRSWMVPHGTVELRVGGAYRTSYDESVDLDGPEAIVNEILAYEPERMIAFRNVQAPSGFENVELFQQTWSVVYFEPLGSMRTRLVSKGMGYGEGSEWDRLYAYFDKGNAYLFGRLQEAIGDGVDRDHSPAGVLEALRPFVGGGWQARGESPAGGVLRSVFVVEPASGGTQLAARGWIGDDEAMRAHAVSVMGANPAAGEAWSWQWMEDGSELSGPMWLGHGAVHMDLTLTTPGGASQPMHATYEFVDDETMRWTMLGPDGGIFAELDFERVGLDELDDLVETAMNGADEPERFAAERRDEAIVVEREVDAPVSEVYRAWTTDDGFREAYGRDTKIELRVGGAYEIYWDSVNKIGSNGCRVLSFSPDEYVAFSWNAPPSIPEIREKRTIVTVSLESLENGRTLMRIRNDGYGLGEAWDEAFAYFERAWPRVADTIVAHFARER